MKKELAKELKAKLSYEFNRFVLQMLCTSKENIFAHAEEIVSKKKLFQDLTIQIEKNTINNNALDNLLNCDNTLDNLYRKHLQEEV